jgi:hypothetical protein
MLYFLVFRVGTFSHSTLLLPHLSLGVGRRRRVRIFRCALTTYIGRLRRRRERLFSELLNPFLGRRQYSGAQLRTIISDCDKFPLRRVHIRCSASGSEKYLRTRTHTAFSQFLNPSASSVVVVKRAVVWTHLLNICATYTADLVLSFAEYSR